MHITRHLLPASAMLAMLASSLAGQSADPGHHFMYGKQVLPLTLDVGRVAYFAPDAGVLKPSATGDIVSQAPTAVAGWSFAALAPAAQSDAGVKRVLRQLANEVPPGAFLAPVFVTESGPAIVTGDLLVGFEPHITRAQVDAALAGVGEITSADYARLPNVFRVRSRSRNGFDALDAANALARLEIVRFAEPDMIRTARMASTIPSDDAFFRQWGLHNTGQNVAQGIPELCCSVPCTGACFPPCPDPCVSVGFPPCNQMPGGVADFDIDAPEAWDITLGDPGIMIVVFDEWVQFDHPDLMRDADMQMDFTGQAVTACDDHGTAVAGVVSARMDGSGAVGVAPACTLAAARVIVPDVPCNGQEGAVTASWIIDGLTWAESIGARVTNHSYGFGPPSAALDAKFLQTRQAGMVHVGAAGTCSCPTVSYPARAPGVNAVSGLNYLTSAVMSDTSFGPEIDLSAPGFLVWTTDVEGDVGVGHFGVETCNEYSMYIGSSFAAPHVAGVAGLVLSIRPSLSAAEVEQILRDAAVDLGTPGHDTLYGWGMVNAMNAVLLAMPGAGDVNGDGAVDINDLLAVISAWGACASPCPPHANCLVDIAPPPAGNCVVDIDDLLLVISNWTP